MNNEDEQAKKDVIEYMADYRSYVLDCVNDDNFDLTTLEDWYTWLEEEKEEQKIRCSECGSLNTNDNGTDKLCTDCGFISKVTEDNKGNWRKE